MFNNKELTADLGGLEIGATGPSRLQFVLQADKRRVVVKLAADEARWFAYPLGHWADESETIEPAPLNSRDQ